MRIVIPVFLLLFSLPALAEPKFEVDMVTQTVSVVGLEEVLQGCELHKGTFTVAGTQYSESGNTISLIKFKRNDGQILAIPTGFEQLSNVDKDRAQKVIEEGAQYFIEFSSCGSGGFMRLINLYLTPRL